MPLDISFPIAFLGGLLSFLSPCVLPLVPAYLCYLGGTSLEQLNEGDTIDPAISRRMMLSALVFVAGFSTVFITLGATATGVSRLLLQNIDILSKAAGILIILLGLHFLGLFKFAFLNREVRFHPTKQAGLGGSYVIGVAFAFGWTPCIGPVLAAVLTVAASQETVGAGTALLAVYSAGLGLPFLASSLFARPFLRFMVRFRRHIGKVEKTMGALLVFTGVLFFTGALGEFSFWMLEAFPTLGNIEALVLGDNPAGL
ncbi:MAG: cytochrome c biogenesis CcdA family protein [Hyphomicrobiales bacterium]